uniref:Transmembrane protein 241 n=1 Tax=Chelonoidis abingdonii TaxID=106734 RepID=A0A8C0IM42_CHEAB
MWGQNTELNKYVQLCLRKPFYIGQHKQLLLMAICKRNVVNNGIFHFFYRSEVLTWLPASALFVGIIYAGSRALSRLPIPVFLTVHNAAEVITCGFQKFVVLFLLIAAGCLPFFDTQFDPDGYFWALIHLICVGKKPVKQANYGMLNKYCNDYLIAFPYVLLCSSGDLFSALDFPFLYFYRFHSSCCASGLLGFFLMLHTVKLKSITSSWQYAAWSFLAKVRERPSAELGRSVSPGCLDFGALFRASSRYSLHKIWSCHCPWSFTSLHC